MKKNILKILFLVLTIAVIIKVNAQNEIDTLKEKINIQKDILNGIDERLMTTESDVSKLTKIKISGYIQAQYTKSELAGDYPKDYFSLRRVRLKTIYEPAKGVAFVVQPDFIPGGLSLKDAYAVINEPWLRTFSLWAGQFNRPNFEVEYSSSQREIVERSRLIRALYPGEREIGLKLEANPQAIPLKLQLALLNGNNALTYKDAAGANINPTNKDYDQLKDLMARLTYSLKFGSFGGLDFGAHTYMGYVKAGSTKVVKSDFTPDTDVKIQDALKRNWIGGEFQLYADILGGLSVKAEYITGINATPGFSATAKTTETKSAFAMQGDSLFTTVNVTNATTNTISPNQLKNFSGYYIYLVKNIGKKHQFAMRYDFYDPNTKISGSQIGDKKFEANSKETKSTVKSDIKNNNRTTTTINDITETKYSYKSGTADIAYSTISLAWNYYFDDNIRITICYDMPVNEKAAKGKVTSSYKRVDGSTGILYYGNILSQNMLTFRIQAKF